MKVTIRPLIEEDAYTSVKWRNDPEVFKYTGNTYKHEIKIENELEWIRKVMANPHDYRCAILADGLYVGNIYLTDIHDGTAHYHIFIGDKNYWGKGIAKQASLLILDYGFRVLKLKEIQLRVRKENVSAYNLYLKLGFKEVKQEGEWTSMIILAKNVERNEPNFWVDVRCFTFNQSDYITDAMNGFCIQQTDFPYVCLIVDDASTDGEQELIRKYIKENFDLSEGSEAYREETEYAHIVYARHKSNQNCYFVVLFLKENHYSNPALAGEKMKYLGKWRDYCKYEAICEGDDYWIDPLKLQKQIDFLENHPDYGAVYTDFDGYMQETGEKVDMHIVPQNGWQFETMLHDKLNIWTLTTCFRKELLKHQPSLSPVKYFTGDRLLFLTITSRTKVYCLNEKTAVYRILKNSASHFTDPLKGIEFQYKCMNTHVHFLTPSVSKETTSWVHNRNLSTTLNYALAYDKPEILKDIVCSLSEIKRLRYLLIYLLWKFVSLNKLTFTMARLLVHRKSTLHMT